MFSVMFLKHATIQPYRLRPSSPNAQGYNMATLFIFTVLIHGAISNHEKAMQHESQDLWKFSRTTVKKFFAF